MAETPTTPTPTEVVTFEALQAAAPYIATKTDVDEKIAAAGGAQFVAATAEEVVALFQNRTTGGAGGGEEGGTP